LKQNFGVTKFIFLKFLNFEKYFFLKFFLRWQFFVEGGLEGMHLSLHKSKRARKILSQKLLDKHGGARPQHKNWFPSSLVKLFAFHFFLLLKTSILQAISKENKRLLNRCAGM